MKFRDDYAPIESFERPWVTRAEDHGKARDVRDYIIGEREDDLVTVDELSTGTDIDISEKRITRIVENYDWFEPCGVTPDGDVVRAAELDPLRVENGGTYAVRLTRKGHQALRDDDLRDYEDIAGEPYERATEVRARA